MKLLIKSGLLLGLCSCAKLHHVQIGEVDGSKGERMTKFEIKVSETGVNFEEAGNYIDAFSGSKSKNAGRGETVSGYIGLFQMGPRTGEPVFSDKYAENIGQSIYKECPSGQVTGVMSVRESRKYPVISGEIVKVTGYCLEVRASKEESTVSEDDSSKGSSEAKGSKQSGDK